MDSVDSTIEKIKNDEVYKERILKEKRELETTRASINKTIRDTITLTERSSLKQSELNKTVEKLRIQLQKENIRHNSLLMQQNMLIQKLEELRYKSNDGISNVWDLRSSFCRQTYATSDNYDIWALLKKPAHTEPSVSKMSNPNNESIIVNTENRIKLAINRRSEAIAERDRLLLEPDNGVEFLRIKNALKYSLEKIADLRK